MKSNHLVMVLLFGVLLLVISFPVHSKTEHEKKTETQHKRAEYTENATAFKTQMEQELEEKLAEIEGVGSVHVMITLKSSSEKILAEDRENAQETVRESDSQGGTRSTSRDNQKDTIIYEQPQTGGETPYIVKEYLPEVEGVLVIAEGGDSSAVKEMLTSAVQALFGIDMHKIRVVKGRRVSD